MVYSAENAHIQPDDVNLSINGDKVILSADNGLLDLVYKMKTEANPEASFIRKKITEFTDKWTKKGKMEVSISKGNEKPVTIIVDLVKSSKRHFVSFAGGEKHSNKPLYTTKEYYKTAQEIADYLIKYKNKVNTKETEESPPQSQTRARRNAIEGSDPSSDIGDFLNKKSTK